jgi:Spy/CpxP family protein refolding chaperone
MHLTSRPCAAAVLAAALAALTLPAGAQTLRAAAQSTSATPQGLHHPFERLRNCLGILDLSEAQKADIQAIFEAAKPQAEIYFATLKADRDTLASDLSQSPPDPCVVGKDFLQLHADREAARAFFASVRDQVLAVLTDTQKARLAGCLAAPRLAAASARPDAGVTE